MSGQNAPGRHERGPVRSAGPLLRSRRPARYRSCLSAHATGVISRRVPLFGSWRRPLEALNGEAAPLRIQESVTSVMDSKWRRSKGPPTWKKAGAVIVTAPAPLSVCRWPTVVRTTFIRSEHLIVTVRQSIGKISLRFLFAN